MVKNITVYERLTKVIEVGTDRFGNPEYHYEPKLVQLGAPQDCESLETYLEYFRKGLNITVHEVEDHKIRVWLTGCRNPFYITWED